MKATKKIYKPVRFKVRCLMLGTKTRAIPNKKKQASKENCRNKEVMR